MDNYHNHPDFDNYLLNQTHYYHSLNNFSKGSKFSKDMGMKNMIMKKNLKESGVKDPHPHKLSRYQAQSYSDKVVKNKKRNNSSEIVMVYHPSTKKGYPQLKSALANYPKNPNSLSESAQASGRKKRSHSQCGTHGKRPKSTKNSIGGRKYKASNQMHNVSADTKLHSINHSIDHSTLMAHERPNSATESSRYSKYERKGKKHFMDSNKESITTSIEVPNIELQNKEGNFKKYKHGSHNLGYQKTAEIVTSNIPKNMSKGATKSISNSQKLLRSTSRGGKGKKSKSKSH